MLITKPLSVKALKKIYPDGNIDVTVACSLKEIYTSGCFDYFLDMLEPKICRYGFVSDVKTEVVGLYPNKGKNLVLIRVIGNWRATYKFQVEDVQAGLIK